jgi:biotin carboxyl carrier protein
MKFLARLNDKEFNVDVERNDNFFEFTILDKKFQVSSSNMNNGSLTLIVDGNVFNLICSGNNGDYAIKVKDSSYNVKVEEEWKARFSKTFESKKKHSVIELKSPMPGKVIRINVKPDETVKKDQGLIVIEAMKMENELRSPVDGNIESLNVKVGDIANGQDILLIINPSQKL